MIFLKNNSDTKPLQNDDDIEYCMKVGFHIPSPPSASFMLYDLSQQQKTTTVHMQENQEIKLTN
jgi:hypothetical protein